MRKAFALVLALVLALGMIGAASAEEHEPVTLRFTFWGSTIEKQAVETALANFMEAYPWITVESQHIPTDYVAKLTAMLAGGEEPDIAYMEAQVVNEWGLDGVLVNVLDLMEKDPDISYEDFNSEIWYSWADGCAAGTNSAIEAYALYYNKDLFDAAGVAYPPSKLDDVWTWEEFIDVATQLTLDYDGHHPGEEGFDPDNIMQYGVKMSTGIDSVLAYVYQNGGRYLSEDGMSFALCEPAATEALQAVADLINVYHVCPTPAASSSLPDIASALETGRCAMYVNGQWVQLDLAADESLNWSVGLLPQFGSEYCTIILGSPTVIFKSTEHPEESWLLFKWLANPSSVMNLMAGGLWMPLLNDWYTDEEKIAMWTDNPAHPPEYKDAVMAAVTDFGKATAVYNTRNYAAISAVVDAALDEIWSGAKTAEQAMNDIKPTVDELCQGYYNPELRTY